MFNLRLRAAGHPVPPSHRVATRLFPLPRIAADRGDEVFVSLN